MKDAEKERERRLEESGINGYKRSKLTRDRDRDVSELFALGMAHLPTAHGEVLYEQRLFNQDSGINTGSIADDSYDYYDKPLFAPSKPHLSQNTRANLVKTDTPIKKYR